MKGTYQELFKRYLQSSGLQLTNQRLRVVAFFQKMPGVYSAEEIYAVVRKSDPAIGLSTVYRTVKLLVKAGLVCQRQDNDSVVRFKAILQ